VFVGGVHAEMALSLFGRQGQDILDSLASGTVWDPFEGFSVLENSPSRQFARDAHAVANTQIDWRETSDAHIFKADLPGLTKEEVKVQVVEGRTLEIGGERKKEEVQKGDTWHRVERSQGSFMRRFRLPENTNVEGIKAAVVDGVLTVTIPKLQKPKPQVRQIDIA
jgi:HSP20 family protein